MSHIKFTWIGSEYSEEGRAVYIIEGVTVLSLVLPNFTTANGISNALDLAYRGGKEAGIKQAKAAMLAGVDKL